MEVRYRCTVDGAQENGGQLNWGAGAGWVATRTRATVDGVVVRLPHRRPAVSVEGGCVDVLSGQRSILDAELGDVFAADSMSIGLLVRQGMEGG